MEFQELDTLCGAPLYVSRIPHSEVVAAGVLARVGSRDENWPGEAGLAHAFEHMCFQGNEKFPTSGELAEYIEKSGGEIDAWTWKEMTFYWVLLPENQFRRGAAYLYHLVRTPNLRPENIQTEMQTVIREIVERNDNPEHFVEDIMNVGAYGNHPLSKEVLGIPRSVVSFRTRDFRKFQEKFYHPSNLVFLVAGNVKPKIAQKLFNEFFRETDERLPNKRNEIVSVGGQTKIKVLHKEVGQVYMRLGALVGPAREKSTATLNFFTSMLDGDMSFPLYQEFQSKRGLCYSVRAELTRWTDRGLFSIYAAVDSKRWRQARSLIFEIMERSARDEKLFKKTKKFLRGRLSLELENPKEAVDGAAEDIALIGKPRTLKEKFREIEKTNPEDVREAVGRYLDPKNFVEAYIVPPDFEFRER